MRFYIKEARIASNLTQKQLADMLGVTDATLSGYETGAHDPKSYKLIEIARICNTTVDFLLGVERKDDPNIVRSLDTIALEQEEQELVDIYRELTSIGQQALMGTARGLYANPDMKKGGASSRTTA